MEQKPQGQVAALRRREWQTLGEAAENDWFAS